MLFMGALAVALLVLALWAADRWQFGTLGQRDVPMAPSTATLMVLLALAGLRPAARRQGQLTGVVLIAAGAAALFWDVGGVESAFVKFLTGDAATAQPIPIGVMSPLTASAFALSGLSLLTRHVRSRGLAHAGPACATLVLILASSIAAGLILGVPLHFGASVPMAATTSAAFLGCALGLASRAVQIPGRCRS